MQEQTVSHADPLAPLDGETGPAFRARLTAALARHHEETKTSRGFALARIKGAKFGIVDSDRANFLGLSFSVDLLEPVGGSSWLYLTRDESLAVLEEIGEASNLNGTLCWVYVSGAGSSPVRFVRMVRS